MKRSNAATERLFKNAGIEAGMRVLELGCGPGEVTEVLSELIGASGQVLAIDRSNEMLAIAQDRFRESGIRNVRFLCADLSEGPGFLQGIAQPAFDAIVGRRVLMYLSKPDAVIRGLLPWLTPRGIVIFEEADSTIGPGRVASMPSHDKAVAWLGEMLAVEGVDRSMGFHLPATLTQAGLRFEGIWAEAVIEGQGDQYPLPELLRLLDPRLESADVATRADIEQLTAQIIAEANDPTQVYMSGMRFCASARKI
ncbi:MAG: class I SAM-dependent methyltransferase [Verrucomicrobiota bacterium]